MPSPAILKQLLCQLTTCRYGKWQLTVREYVAKCQLTCGYGPRWQLTICEYANWQLTLYEYGAGAGARERS